MCCLETAHSCDHVADHASVCWYSAIQVLMKVPILRNSQRVRFNRHQNWHMCGLCAKNISFRKMVRIELMRVECKVCSLQVNHIGEPSRRFAVTSLASTLE